MPRSIVIVSLLIVASVMVAPLRLYNILHVCTCGDPPTTQRGFPPLKHNPNAILHPCGSCVHTCIQATGSNATMLGVRSLHFRGHRSVFNLSLNIAKSEFGMCFAIAPKGAGAPILLSHPGTKGAGGLPTKTCLEFSIQKFKPHLTCDCFSGWHSKSPNTQ